MGEEYFEFNHFRPQKLLKPDSTDFFSLMAASDFLGSHCIKVGRFEKNVLSDLV